MPALSFILIVKRVAVVMNKTIKNVIVVVSIGCLSLMIGLQLTTNDGPLDLTTNTLTTSLDETTNTAHTPKLNKIPSSEVLGYDSKLGPLPDSLEGTIMMNALVVDEAGNLRISNDIRRIFDYFLSRPTGLVLHWSLQHGFQPVDGSEGSMPNGLQISSNENIMYLNMYAGKELRVLERSTGNVVQSIAVKGADNSNWDLQDPGKLLVTTHTMSLFGMLGCISSADGNCPVPLTVYELDTESGTMRSLLALDGDYFGAGTAAVRMGDHLFVGSFAGHRVLIAPLGYGVSQ